jgi:hypothetical protein
VGQLEEQPGTGAVVEQPATLSGGEQRRERIHHEPVATPATAGVVPGQERAVLAAAV